MENRFEHSGPESQGWGNYVAPPVYGSGADLCDHVIGRLPELLENDGSVRPEMAMAIYGHLAVCSSCAREHNQMQRLIAKIEAVPPVEMPTDYSGLIMQRIQAQADIASKARTTAAEIPLPRTLDEHAVVNRSAAATGSATSVTAQSATQQQQSVISRTETYQWQRLSVGAALTGVLAFFVSTAWGRQMLGVNVETAAAWLAQIGDLVRRVPVLGWIVGMVLTILAQTGDRLADAYRSLGCLAARGLAIDIAMAAVACCILRRQRIQRIGA